MATTFTRTSAGAVKMVRDGKPISFTDLRARISTGKNNTQVIIECEGEDIVLDASEITQINGAASPVGAELIADKLRDDVFFLKDKNVMRHVFASNVALSHTGVTTETTVFTGTIPANSIGVNGSFIANFITSTTNSAGTKLFRLKFNGTTVYSYTPTTSIAQRSQGQITNRNSLTSQIAGPNSVVGFGVAASSAVQTFSINTAADIIVTVTVQLSSGTDTATLEAFQILAIG